MNEIIRELQDDIQREKWLAVWQRYGNVLIGGAVTIVLAAAGWQGYTAYRDHRSEQYTVELLEAVRNPSVEAFQNVAKTTQGVHADIARLIEAQLLVSEKKTDEALNVVSGVAKSSANAFPNQLAQALTADKNVASKQSKSAFHLTELERAGWAALVAGDHAAAEKAFSSLQSSETAPDSLKDRAKSALAFIQSRKKTAPAESAKQS